MSALSGPARRCRIHSGVTGHRWRRSGLLPRKRPLPDKEACTRFGSGGSSIEQGDFSEAFGSADIVTAGDAALTG